MAERLGERTGGGRLFMPLSKAVLVAIAGRWGFPGTGPIGDL